MSIFSQAKIKYLRELYVCFKQIYAAYKQVEYKKIFFGQFVPLITKLMKKLKVSIVNEQIYYTKRALIDFLNSVKTQFKSILDLDLNKEGYLASSIHSYFKLSKDKWLENDIIK